jgi:membrane AbrB-like protein
MRFWRRGSTFWCTLVAGYFAVVVILIWVAMPSPFLFAGVVAGSMCASRMSNPQPFPDRVRQVGIAVIGVAAGSRIEEDVMRAVAAEHGGVLGGVVATLAISMAAGQLLHLSPYVSGPQAVFASIAGGASGVTAVAREMDADETIVLSVQYLRVLFVLATVPLVAPLLGATEAMDRVDMSESATLGSVCLTIICVAGGSGLARVPHFSASRLVLPLLFASALSLTGAFPSSTVPSAILNFGYATTGLMVGLSFTPTAVRQLARLMPFAPIQVILSVSGYAVVGLVFTEVADVSQLDGYLATTPGGCQP